ncbi:flagellar protein FlaG [Aquibacillus salsiterrae]|uniref:Flagellar protein FlaG n=1 Tax=Aquibacillus salsiterrae TaxID=2950439 RepID=A0A9X3WB16_9BACI|nr:flagellar protein FlaG [Aquibacillus salsiterrae]MDC3416132.1 flagellar protein FlaG [Aquibacillus salsiterrae]
MNVGKIISGSQLLQKAERIGFPSSARERSVIEKSVQTSEEIKQALNDGEKDLNKDEVKEMVKSMNDFLGATHTALKFQYHDKLQEYYVSIIDAETNKVIKEIPPKKLLDAYASMAELMGFIVDETV